MKRLRSMLLLLATAYRTLIRTAQLTLLIGSSGSGRSWSNLSRRCRVSQLSHLARLLRALSACAECGCWDCWEYSQHIIIIWHLKHVPSVTTESTKCFAEIHLEFTELNIWWVKLTNFLINWDSVLSSSKYFGKLRAKSFISAIVKCWAEYSAVSAFYLVSAFINP